MKLDLTHEEERTEGFQKQIHAQFGKPGSSEGFAKVSAPANIKQNTQEIFKAGKMEGFHIPGNRNTPETQTNMQAGMDAGKAVKAPQHGATEMHGSLHARDTKPWHVDKETRLAGGLTAREVSSSWNNLITHMVARGSEAKALKAWEAQNQKEEWALRRGIDIEKNRIDHERNLSQDEQWRSVLALDEKRFGLDQAKHRQDIITTDRDFRMRGRELDLDERRVKTLESAEKRMERGQLFDEKMEATKEGRQIVAAALSEKLGIGIAGKGGKMDADGEALTSAIGSIIGKAFGPDTPVDQIADRIEEVIEVLRDQGMFGAGGRDEGFDASPTELLEALMSVDQNAVVDLLKKKAGEKGQSDQEMGAALEAWKRGHASQSGRLRDDRRRDFISGKGDYGVGGRQGPPQQTGEKMSRVARRFMPGTAQYQSNQDRIEWENYIGQQPDWYKEFLNERN